VLHALAAEALSIHAVNDRCMQLRLNSACVRSHLPTSTQLETLYKDLHTYHGGRCTLQADWEYKNQRAERLARTAAQQCPRAAQRVRQPEVDQALPRRNYYQPLAESASGEGDASDDEIPDVQPPGAPQRRPAAQQPAATRPRPARAQMPPGPAGPAQLQVASWNANGLTAVKVHELLSLAQQRCVLVVAVQESWERADGAWQQAAEAHGYSWHGCRRHRGAGGGVGFFVHNSIATQASVHIEPGAQNENELELLWLHLEVKQRKRAAVRVCLASTYMPNSAKADAVISTAWDALEEAVMVKAATVEGHTVVLGDLNARLPPAEGPDSRYGQHGEQQADVNPGVGAWKAGEHLQRVMELCELYSLSGRAAPANADDVYTYITQEGTPEVRRSILDYALVCKQLMENGASGEVKDSSVWNIAGSPHRVLGAALPLTVSRARGARPKPFWKWRVDKFTSKDHGAETKQEYQEALEVRASEIEQAAQGDMETLAAATVHAILATAQECIGQKLIKPGRTKAWMTPEIDLGILERRQLHAAMKRTQCPAAKAAYEDQKAWVLALVKARKEQF
jgi:exonuclease III